MEIPDLDQAPLERPEGQAVNDTVQTDFADSQTMEQRLEASQSNKDLNTRLAWQRYGHALANNPHSIHYSPTKAK